jgi:hypothetical protein
VPQGQMCFDVVVYIWGLFFSVFFLSHIRMHLWGWLVVFLSFLFTSWCNFDVCGCTAVPLCQMCFDMVIYVCVFLFCILSFLSGA